jgi:hypothetical protein
MMLNSPKALVRTEVALLLTDPIKDSAKANVALLPGFSPATILSQPQLGYAHNKVPITHQYYRSIFCFPEVVFPSGNAWDVL